MDLKVVVRMPRSKRDVKERVEHARPRCHTLQVGNGVVQPEWDTCECHGDKHMDRALPIRGGILKIPCSTKR